MPLRQFLSKIFLRERGQPKIYDGHFKLHRDVNAVEFANEIVIKYADKHDQRILIHDNPITRHVVEEAWHVPSRLKRQKPHHIRK